MFRYAAFKPWLHRRPFVGVTLSRRRITTFGFGVASAGISALVLSPTIRLDAPSPAEPDMVKDPATGIEFPSTLRIPSRFPLPKYTLLGVGVRKVSFLNIKVYSVGFYADLAGVSPINRNASFDEKIRHVVENSSCVIRIIPTRSTSYSHLRDGFMRTLQARMVLHKNKGLLTATEEAAAMSPLLKLKSLFPNTPLTKYTPLDILLVPRGYGTTSDFNNQERRLVIRDLGSISNTWVSQEFMLAYFEDQGISPSLKQAVESRLQDFGK